MGFLGGLFDGVKSVLGIAGEAKNAGIKVPGIPTPQEPIIRSGGQIGQETLDYYNAAFPGTTPAERLGHSPSNVSGIQSAESQIKSAQKMQEREFKQQNTITDKNNLASIITATTPISAAARDSAIQAYSSLLKGGSSKPYQTQTTMSEQKLSHEIGNIKSSTSKNMAERAVNVVKRMNLVSEGEGIKIRNEYIADAEKAGIDRDKALAELSHAEAVMAPVRAVGGAASNIGQMISSFKGASVPSVSFKKKRDSYY